MLFALTLILLLSSSGMVLLFYAKHWELTTGRVLFGTVRPKFARGAHRLLIFFEYQIPGLVTRGAASSIRWLRFQAMGALAHALIAIEQALERTLNTLRHGLSPAKQAKLDTSDTSEVSAFLREVVEHKRKLTHITGRRRASQSKVTSNPLQDAAPQKISDINTPH